MLVLVVWFGCSLGVYFFCRGVVGLFCGFASMTFSFDLAVRVLQVVGGLIHIY